MILQGEPGEKGLPGFPGEDGLTVSISWSFCHHFSLGFVICILQHYANCHMTNTNAVMQLVKVMSRDMQ